MEELVEGVTLRRSNEAIETSRSPSMDLHLMASWDGTEVIRQEVPAGKRFGLRPEEGWEALECLIVLHGRAICEHEDRVLELGPGDSLTGHPVKEPCILRAVTDLTALYICSRPVFHQVSEDLQRLQELAIAVEQKDGYTSDHCWRIQQLSAKVGHALGLSPIRMHYLLYGSLLHDVGKVGVLDAVLNKPGKLTAEEWVIMKQHTIIGRDMLVGTQLAGAASIPEQHHERLDGSGYPHGLQGDQISLEAQIVAVVDSYDAMTSDRVYRPSLSKTEAIAELERGVGKLYRRDVVEAFLSCIGKDI